MFCAVAHRNINGIVAVFFVIRADAYGTAISMHQNQKNVVFTKNIKIKNTNYLHKYNNVEGL